LEYLRNGRPWWLTFLEHPGMEATNNRGERGLREVIVIRKIVGPLRNWKGSEAFAHLLSVFGTWKLRGENLSPNLYAALS
jgi:transposase